MNYNIPDAKLDHMQFNKNIVSIKNIRKLILLELINNQKKYMLINDCIPMRDNNGNLPYYALQGEDVEFLYTYGCLNPNPENYDFLSKDEKKFYNQKFHASGVIFGEKVKSIFVFDKEKDFNIIEDIEERRLVKKLANDILNSVWQPIKNDFLLNK